MARAIRSIVEHKQTPEERRASAMADVETAIADNAEAAVEFMKMIRLLQQRGALNIVNAFLQKSDDIMKIIVDQAGKPEYAGGLKNGIALTQMLSSMDTRVLHHLVGSLSQTSKAIEEGKVQKVGGIFDLLRTLRDPDISAGLGVMLGLVKGIGHSIREASSSQDGTAAEWKKAP